MGRVAIVEGGGGQGCNNSRVGFAIVAFLLVVLVLRLAQGAIGGFVDRPCHVVVAPIEGEFAHLFSILLFAVLGWHLLPRLILLLILG